MTLYDLLKRLKEHHKNLDYERSKTPWSIGLRKVRECLPDWHRRHGLEQFETIIRQMFAADFAEAFAQASCDPLMSSSDEQEPESRATIELFASNTFSDRVGRQVTDLIKDELALASKNGSAYRILADIYAEFPEFVDKAFPFVQETVA